jgi:hypothetical protein
LADAFVALLTGESNPGIPSDCALSILVNSIAISEANVMYALILMLEFWRTKVASNKFTKNINMEY